MEAKNLTPSLGEDDAQDVTRRLDSPSENTCNQKARRFDSAVLIVNTRSRVGRSAAASALDYLGLLGVTVKVAYVLEDATRLPETVRGALADGHDLIVLGGGDGSVSTVAGVLAGSDAVLGVLPLGTANDFAHTMGIPFELAAACATVADGVVADVDLGLAEDHHYVNVASMGLGSAVAEAISPRLKRAMGPLAYPFATVRAYLDQESFEAGFAFPEYDHEAVAIGDLIHVAVGNGRYYGGGLVVAPGSEIEDHALDVYAIEASAAPELTRIAWGLRTGDFVNNERVHHWRTKRVRVFTHPRLPINLDGELIRRTPRTFAVVPAALKVLVPQTSLVARTSRAYAAADLELVANR
jgi:YegS/Rv2252/BmrU family lipid kinase